jgi:hypothetical protein
MQVIGKVPLSFGWTQPSYMLLACINKVRCMASVRSLALFCSDAIKGVPPPLGVLLA